MLFLLSILYSLFSIPPKRQQGRKLITTTMVSDLHKILVVTLFI